MPHRWSRRQVVQGASVAGLTLVAHSACAPSATPSTPRAARGQAPKVARIAVLFGLTPALLPAHEAFRAALRELGYVEGENLQIETPYTPDVTDDQLPGLVAHLIERGTDAFVVAGLPATRAAKDATTTIPIVMVAGGVDVVRAGLVASLARPGGNVTGLTDITEQLTAKRLELLRDLVPGAARVAVLGNPNTTASQLSEAQAAASALDLQLQSLAVHGPADFEAAFEAATRDRADALLVLPDPLTVVNQAQLGQLATAQRLPAVHSMRGFVAAGGLAAYGASFADLARRAATYVDKVLKGTNPTDLPIEQPMRFDLVINLKTAQALGLTIPPHVLLQATEVIQ
jgi:putative tryptophan/tyrosine transport system substrate-binding protein